MAAWSSPPSPRSPPRAACNEPRAETGVGANHAEHGVAGAIEPLDERLVVGGRAVAGQGSGHRAAEVDVLDKEPATRSHGGQQVGQGRGVIGDVFDNGTGMDHVEGGFLRWARVDVVAAHVQIGAVVLVEEAGVEVRGDNPPAGTDPVGQPQRHRAGAAADLQALPPLAHAQVGKVAGRRSVIERLQTVSSRSRSRCHVWSNT